MLNITLWYIFTHVFSSLYILHAYIYIPPFIWCFRAAFFVRIFLLLPSYFICGLAPFFPPWFWVPCFGQILLHFIFLTNIPVTHHETLIINMQNNTSSLCSPSFPSTSSSPHPHLFTIGLECVALRSSADSQILGPNLLDVNILSYKKIKKTGRNSLDCCRVLLFFWSWLNVSDHETNVNICQRWAESTFI